jgi:hypothetical protein
VSRLCFLRQIRPLVPPFPPVGTVAAPCGSPAVPHLHRYYGVVRLLVHLSRPPLASLGESVPPMMRGDGGALLGSWEIPVEACPELGTPATPVRPRIIGRPSAAFRLVNGVGIATSRVFGAESSRPASLLCTLRTHQSPDEWQHSLPACLLDCDRAGLTPAGFQQEVSPFHLRFLLFQTFPSAITMSAVSSTSLSTRRHALGRRAPFRSRGWFCAFPTLGSLLIVRVQNSVRPIHLFDRNFDHDYDFELPWEGERDAQSLRR